MITSANLRFSYSAQKNFAFPDIKCNDKETLLILGQSGRGKTTLLHLLALLLKPDSGEIFIADRQVSSFSQEKIINMRANHIGVIYQRPHFVSSLSVLDNILLSNYLANKHRDKKKAIYLAEQLGFAEHLQKKTSRLSQGEQQRVSIARSLMNIPIAKR
jgi:lipoprotein-releasing system ATP-binding protein